MCPSWRHRFPSLVPVLIGRRMDWRKRRVSGRDADGKFISAPSGVTQRFVSPRMGAVELPKPLKNKDFWEINSFGEIWRPVGDCTLLERSMTWSQVGNGIFPLNYAAFCQEVSHRESVTWSCASGQEWPGCHKAKRASRLLPRLGSLVDRRQPTAAPECEIARSAKLVRDPCQS